jgi:hypothetical protein
MNPQQRTKLFGLLFLIGGLVMTILHWRYALAYGKYFVAMSILAPFVACAGLAMLLYPPALTETGAVQQHPWKELPTGQKTLYGLGGVLGVVNWVLISGVLSRF